MKQSSMYIVGRVPKLPPQYARVLVPLLMSGLMSGIVCAVNLLRAMGWTWQAAAAWPSTWLMAWAVAFPAVMLVMPVVQRITARLVRQPCAPSRSA